jgi:hypothetical protein
MGRISMGRAIGDAYDFAFGKYFTVLGVVWLPLLLIAVGEYLVIFPLFRHLPDIFEFALRHPHEHASPPPEFMAMNGYIALVNLAMILVMVWIRVGITKAALDLPRGPRFAYFFVGMDELRVVGAYVVFVALLYGVIIAAVIVVAIVAAVVGALVAGGAFAQYDFSGLAPWAIGAAVALYVAFIAALIYVQTRLVFLLVPVTVVEKRFGLWRSWELSKGNFWRIVVIAIGTVSPLVLVEIMFLLALYIPIAVGVVSMLHHHPEILHDHAAAPVAIFAEVFRRAIQLLPYTAIFGLALSPLIFGLTFSPSAFAYRSLVEKSGGKINAG